jgi:hypothetical protein
MSRSAAFLFLVLAAPLATLAPASAQEQPTGAQREAIKTDCRSDFIKHCSGVEPGGMPALQCLEKNMASLSETCQAAVKPVEEETEG